MTTEGERVAGLEAALRAAGAILEALREAIDRKPDPRAEIHVDLTPLFESMVVAASDSARAALAGLREPPPEENPLCKCGDRLSRHTEHGCTWNPDCLCLGFEPMEEAPAGPSGERTNG